MTGIEIPNTTSSNLGIAYAKTKGAGASMVRIVLSWRDVSPTSAPSVGAQSNPATYNWVGFDIRIQKALDAGLMPFVTVHRAPDWAETVLPTDPVGTGPKDWHRGTIRPDPAAFGRFGTALAEHVKAQFGEDGVNNWEVWNEPNLRWFLNPQQNPDGTWASPGLYRSLVNEFSDAVHLVDGDAIVIAGSTAPFGKTTQPGPLLFARRVLSAQTRADGWTTHPYTSGGPRHRATAPNDVSLGDLPELRAVIDAAVRNGLLRPKNPPRRFWVGEFGWDSYRPDPEAVPSGLHARWTAEALYWSWRAGVSAFILHQLRDRPLPRYAYQSGLYYCGAVSLADEDACENSTFSYGNDARKLSWQAFRFPFVAYAVSGRIRTWGRTPNSTPGLSVRIDRKVSGGWRSITRVAANEHGIFAKVWSSSATRGTYRASAVIGGTRVYSLGFSLTGVKDRYYYPFGCGGGNAC